MELIILAGFFLMCYGCGAWLISAAKVLWALILKGINQIHQAIRKE